MRVVFSSILQVSDSPMSTNRYIRLITMSAALVLWGTVLTIVTICTSASRGLQPWVSLENVHSKWDRVEAYIWMLMSPRTRSLALLSWWSIPVSSVIVFIFLGFDEDGVSLYKKVGNAIMSVFPSRVLPERHEKFGKAMLLASPALDSRFVLASTFNTLHLTLPDTVPPKLSRCISKTLPTSPHRFRRASRRRLLGSKSLSSPYLTSRERRPCPNQEPNPRCPHWTL